MQHHLAITLISNTLKLTEEREKEKLPLEKYQGNISFMKKGNN